MRLWKRKRDAMKAVVTADAPERSEAEVSRQRARRAREQVIEPLRDLAEQNQFADMIRASLIDGHRNGRRT